MEVCDSLSNKTKFDKKNYINIQYYRYTCRNFNFINLNKPDKFLRFMNRPTFKTF